ncbi:hypothetical protein phytr_5430 [Candidatus Phycorickettsia trachydisci]|uniref:DNA polymerase III subunit chi n=1 Tax=Candidatus Phycorickettsia trachydisci TaxID=2115978 RepID=A0A2P1P884_9RICK|nr:DNA polymerase III subunit chi [Candidatus Phycorickettsia trachydisci]AVP87488.1 hypothetical protein phytr_5430 [Candidatus Phycorickettsia trachydisci]
MSQSINLYKLNTEGLYKYLCQLLSKCYSQGYKTLVKTKDYNQAQEVDNKLWTFAQQSFIPHGLISDEFKESQPILITWQDIVKSDFDTLVLVENIVDIPNFQRAMIFCTEDTQIQNIKNLIKQTINYYTLNSKGTWDHQTI